MKKEWGKYSAMNKDTIRIKYDQIAPRYEDDRIDALAYALFEPGGDRSCFNGLPGRCSKLPSVKV